MCDLVKDHRGHRATAHAATVGCGDFNDEIVGERTVGGGGISSFSK
jgi:hypothetical protein